MITKRRTIKIETAFVLGGLHYIATSPLPECGKQHPEVVKIAKAAIKLINKLSKQKP